MQEAVIKIDAERVIGRVDRFVHGSFIEQLDRCIYGGMYEPGSPLSDEHGFRKDVLQAIRDSGTTLLRWPGGNFASAYHWWDAVGPERVPVWELAWGCVEPNTFGTDEFLRYCELTGIEPMICLNLGTGTIDEAAAWVEYCNSSAPTRWANLRRRNGRETPYGVKYWGLGNEMYGSWQIGQRTPEEHARFAREVAKAIKSVDPSIKLLTAGSGDMYNRDWLRFDEVLLDELIDIIDFHCIHTYTGSADHYMNCASMLLAERMIEGAGALIERAKAKKGITREVKLSFDEWNVAYRKGPGEHEQTYTLSDALAVAGYIHAFYRQCRYIGITAIAQLVNVIAPIIAVPEGMYLQPIYWPLQLYWRNGLPVAVDTWTQCGSHELASRVGVHESLPYVDAVTTVSEDGNQMALFIINHHAEEAVSADVRIDGFVPTGEAEVGEVNGPGLEASNSLREPDLVKTAWRKVSGCGESFRYQLPAHSVTLLKLTAAG
jgi:alpha-L-arabinofuranosidase